MLNYRKMIFMILTLCSSTLLADKGKIIFEKGDYYIVDLGLSCSVIERRSGARLEVGNELVGTLKGYGFKDVYNSTTGTETRIYIEDYRLDEDEAIEKVYELQ